MAANLSPNLTWALANPRWAQTLNPVISGLETLQALPILNGEQIDGISLTANTPKQIAHDLGAVPTGWFEVDKTASSIVWRTAWTAQTITLEASANVTISIWVY